ncbi:hypothetical protein [Photobacterium leiognathi]|uniref:hypothetical protein n=1 Tax=Photobacterium leiognathi TaxID=553611 RepID=UPI000D1673CA|nr:hypothetical protein [Photobacterium leiognathi]PSW53043.1 hypothetical protein C0W50_19740 [Photobacterium leiognathi subsp. mandapamensis]
MMVVLLGGSEHDVNMITTDVMEGFKSRVQHLSIAHVLSADVRVRQLTSALVAARRPRQITIVTGLKSGAEVDLCRSRGATIAHVYGPLGAIYKEVAIKREDLHIAPVPRPDHPAHVLSAEEALSVAQLRLRQQRDKPPVLKSTTHEI